MANESAGEVPSVYGKAMSYDVEVSKDIACAEPMDWSPPVHAKKEKHRRSKTRRTIDAMQPGECIRVVHYDIVCNFMGCSLLSMLCLYRKMGWVIQAYHEDRGIAVVKRFK